MFSINVMLKLFVSIILLLKNKVVFGFVPSPASSANDYQSRSLVLQSSISGIYSSSSPTIQQSNTLEEQLLSIAVMDDESKRRRNFESFVNKQIRAEQQQKIYLKISDLSFVRDVTDCLTRLGNAVQNNEKYVVASFVQIPKFQLGQQGEENRHHDNVVTGYVDISDSLRQVQLWTFVDLLIQFKALVQKLTNESNHYATKKKKEWCGRCEVCTCGRRQ